MGCRPLLHVRLLFSSTANVVSLRAPPPAAALTLQHQPEDHDREVWPDGLYRNTYGDTRHKRAELVEVKLRAAGECVVVVVVVVILYFVTLEPLRCHRRAPFTVASLRASIWALQYSCLTSSSSSSSSSFSHCVHVGVPCVSVWVTLSVAVSVSVALRLNSLLSIYRAHAHHAHALHDAGTARRRTSPSARATST
jgi:hypothetical protein